MRLASIDRLRFIVACRHGLVHLTWKRITLRLSRNEFRRLARLLDQATAGLPPGQFRDGDMRLTWRHDEESEIRVGEFVLLFASSEFTAFADLVGQALDRLDEILASGMWDPVQADDEPSDPLAQFRPDSFSRN
jgi:hypothetical protein